MLITTPDKADSAVKARERNVVLLGFVSFLNDMSSEIIHSILPFFLRGFGSTFTGIGIVGGLLEGFGSIFKIVSGYISDRIGKRNGIVFSGYLISQVSKISLSLASTTPLVGILVTLDRIGKGIRTSPRDALLAESGIKSGRAFGLHRMMDTFGAVVGTVLALYFIRIGFSFSKTILSAGLIGFLALIPLIFIVETAFPIKKPRLTFELKRYAIFSLFMGLSNISYMFYMLKVEEFGIETAIELYFLFNIIYAVFSYPFGLFSDKFGKAKSLSLSYLFLALSSFLMMQNSVHAFFSAFILFGLFKSVSEAQQRALASDLSDAKGFGIGTYHLIYGISTVLGNIAIGMLADVSYSFVFIYLAAISSLVAMLYLLIKF